MNHYGKAIPAKPINHNERKTMKTRLIAALRSAGYKMTAPGSRWVWLNPVQCNCGLVAQELLWISPEQLAEQTCGPSSGLPKGVGSWSIRARKEEHSNCDIPFCPVTKLPMVQIFKDLAAAGLDSPELYASIEMLSDKAVWFRAFGHRVVGFVDGRYVEKFQHKASISSRYLLALADTLEEADNAAMEAYEARPLQLNKKAQPPGEAGPTMTVTTMVEAAQQP